MSNEEIKEKLYDLMINVDGVPVDEVQSYDQLKEKVDLTIKVAWEIIGEIQTDD